MMNYFLSFIIGYLVGSFPTAYLVLKKSHGLDITMNGSGNVGAMNSFRVTKSKRIGLMVFLIDILKGFLSVFLVITFIDKGFIFTILGITAAVFAHCYSPWLKFKGGKGLATAIGGSLLISIPVSIIWAIFWIFHYLFGKDIDHANIFASIITGFFSIFGYALINKYSFIQTTNNFEFGFFVSLIMLIIISKHLKIDYKK